MNEFQKAKLKELSEFFKTQPGTQEITSADLKSYEGKIAGWAFALNIDGVSFDIDFTVDRNFPFSRPRLSLRDRSAYLKIPHIEPDGGICVVPVHSTHTPNAIKDLAVYLINEAEVLLRNGVRRNNANDFINEFQNYWDLQPSLDRSKKFWMLSIPEKTTTISYQIFEGFVLFGTAEECAGWTERRFGKKISSPTNTIFIRLKTPLQPPYPTTNKDLADLAKSESAESLALLKNVIPSKPSPLPVVFGFDTENGIALGGGWLTEPLIGTGKGKAKMRCDGFRPGHIPQEILVERYLSEMRFVPASVKRIDREWIFERGGAAYSDKLETKHVLLVGCGALGGDIALMLGRSGVGTITLVDNDNFEWDNIGRHCLGADSIGKEKQIALAERLSRELPFLQADAVKGKWQDAYRANPKLFHSADIIISTTGEWTSDGELNYLARLDPKFPPVLFGWAEPFGCAGHALAVIDVGGCLGCGMDAFGRFHPSVCHWENPTLKRAPACGAFFEAAGIADIAFAKVLILQLVLDVLLGKVSKSELRSWIAGREMVESSGGKWNQGWVDRYGNPGEGQSIRKVAWESNPKCQLCGTSGDG